jgi:alkyldihydroxyacetonephosphate synthase
VTVTTARSPILATELEAIVGHGNATDQVGHLAAVGAKPGRPDAPVWLVRPGSGPEIAEVVRLANRRKIALSPVGAASRPPRTSGAAERPRILVDLRRMSHVLHLDETSLVVHVQAGLSGYALEKILAPRGLSLGDFPPAVLTSTVGGLLSVRTPGKSSPRHGFLEDAVLGVSAVLPDGRSIHTRVAPRRATGPDLARALCGSEGTLGFITSAVLRIHRQPEARFLTAHRLPSFEAGLSAVHLALREEAAPAGLRVYDDREAWAHFGEGIVDAREAVLVAATAGPTDLAACDRDLIESSVAALGGSRLEESVADLWWRRRTGRDEGVSLPLPTLQVSARPSRQAAVHRAFREAADAAAIELRAYASRFDPYGAVLFATLLDPRSGTPLDDSPAGASARAAIEDAAERAGAMLLGAVPPALSPYFEAMRRQLDPNGIMNPGTLAPT